MIRTNESILSCSASWHGAAILHADTKSSTSSALFGRPRCSCLIKFVLKRALKRTSQSCSSVRASRRPSELAARPILWTRMARTASAFTCWYTSVQDLATFAGVVSTLSRRCSVYLLRTQCLRKFVCRSEIRQTRHSLGYSAFLFLLSFGCKQCTASFEGSEKDGR